MANRDERARIAAEAVAITTAGHYAAPSGTTVSIAEATRHAAERSELVTPNQADALRTRATAAISGRSVPTTFEVRNETTFAAARRLVDRFGPDRVAALNFASAKNPGGGFLAGSQAQEENLARASALHACLQGQMGYYDANRAERSLLYTDHLIVSPRVPVFRDDADQLLDAPYEVTIITAPAPNAGAIAKNEPVALPQVEPTFRRRVDVVLSAAAAYEQRALVLGPWGCGVFGNDPVFGEALMSGGRFAGAFDHVAFAVLDRQGDTLAAFAEVFDVG